MPTSLEIFISSLVADLSEQVDSSIMSLADVLTNAEAFWPVRVIHLLTGSPLWVLGGDTAVALS